MPRKRKHTVKKVTLYVVDGPQFESRSDPDYVECLGLDSESFHPIEPDALRYDLAFVNDAHPDLVAYVSLSSGYYSGNSGRALTPSGKFSSGYSFRSLKASPLASEGQRIEQPDRILVQSTDLFELVESVKGGRGWYTFRHPREGGEHGKVDYAKLRKVPLTEVLAQHPERVFTGPTFA